MGKGGHNPHNDKHSDDEETKTTTNAEVIKNYSFQSDILADVPKLNAIKNAIPAECFQPTVLKSMYYVAKDTLFIAILYMALMYLEKLNLNPLAYGFIYPLYWYFQGTMFTSYFVLGHDCGHGSFSRYPLLNDIMGNILHTSILAPYYPWYVKFKIFISMLYISFYFKRKITHRKHHNHTANIDKDEVFYPKRKSELKDCNVDAHSKIPVPPGFGLALGWLVYLFKGYCPRHVCHFNPFDKFFAGHFFETLISIALYFSWCGCLAYYASLYGIFALLNHHIIPVLVFGAYIVIITFLHHNEPEIGWYPTEEWNYVKGQLSTVDRHYGLVHGVIHNIGTHQIHHLFTSVPHYNLEKATEAFRKAFPHLVHIKDDTILVAFFKMFKIYMNQHVIDDIKQKGFRAFYYSKSS